MSEAPTATGKPEKTLRAGIFCALGLLLLTPFVHVPGSIEPLSVGKALWSRSLIGIIVALWAMLALARPEYRPPRSWLLLIMAAGLCVALLAASTGESLQRSLWSDYSRMQGLVDRAHWFTLALALAALLRRPGEWRVLVGANLLVGSAVAVAVIARASGIEVPALVSPPEQHLPRLSGPFGNPAYLSVYMLLNLVLATGFVLCRKSRGQSNVTPDSTVNPDDGDFTLTPTVRARHGWRMVGDAVFWSVIAGLHLGGLILADSMGAFIGLYAAVCFAALAGAVLARGRTRSIPAILLVVLLLAGAVAGQRFAGGSGAVADGGGPGWTVRASLQWPSVQSRLASWETGLSGFAERPILGWGPENFLVLFGRYARGLAATSESHDLAHNKLIEVAATTGVAGLLLWLAQWALAPAVFLRAAWILTPSIPARTLYIFAAAALAGHLAQLQSLFDTVAGNLVSTLLLAWAVRLEAETFPKKWRPRLPEPLPGVLACRGPQVALAVALILSVAGLAVNGNILAAADARYLNHWSVLDRTTDERIEQFPALANSWRYRYFQELERNWERIRAEDPASAASLLLRADRQADAALRSEPGNWRMTASLARLYKAIAETDPGYAPAARAYLARTRKLAPNRDVFPVWLIPPNELALEPLPGGRVALRWQQGSGAGYHALSRMRDSGPWEFIHFSYATGPGEFIAAPCAGCRYRIKACRYQRVCTEPVEWPAPGSAGTGTLP